MNGLTGEQIDKIKARLDALESIQGILSRVRTLGDKDWRLGCIYNHIAYLLNDDQAEAAWTFVEHAPDDIAALLRRVNAQQDEIDGLRNLVSVLEDSINNAEVCGEQEQSSVSVHFHADDLSPETLAALGDMVQASVKAVRNGTIGTPKK